MGKKIQLKINDSNIYPKIHNDYLLISLDNAQNIADTNDAKVLFNKVLSSYGDGLTFENNGIKIGRGIHKIRIDLTLWIEANAGYSLWSICKNDEILTQNIYPVTNNIYETWRTGNAFIYLDVQEGDLIFSKVKFSVANSGNRLAGFYINSCILGVQVID